MERLSSLSGGIKGEKQQEKKKMNSLNRPMLLGWSVAIIPIAVNEPKYVTISPNISPRLRRITNTELVSNAGALPNSSHLMALVNTISTWPSHEI